MSSWQRTHARANDRRAVKKLVAAEKKAARAKGKVEPKPARPVLPGKNTGSIVSHVQSLKAKAERSKERRNGKHQIIAAAPAAEPSHFEAAFDAQSYSKQIVRANVIRALREGVANGDRTPKGDVLSSWGGYSVKPT